MSKPTRNVTRRKLLGYAATAGAASVFPIVSFAQDKVDEADPTAVALKYKHDGASTGATTFCDTCALYTGEAGAEWGGCNLFPGKVVAAKGWCSAYAPKS